MTAITNACFFVSLLLGATAVMGHYPPRMAPGQAVPLAVSVGGTEVRKCAAVAVRAYAAPSWCVPPEADGAYAVFGPGENCY